jgi:hypothetical protein
MTTATLRSERIDSSSRLEGSCSRQIGITQLPQPFYGVAAQPCSR